MDILGSLNKESNVVTNVITELTEDTKNSSDPIATSVFSSLSSKVDNTIGDINITLTQILCE